MNFHENVKKKSAFKSSLIVVFPYFNDTVISVDDRCTALLPILQTETKCLIKKKNVLNVLMPSAWMITTFCIFAN